MKDRRFDYVPGSITNNDYRLPFEPHDGRSGQGEGRERQDCTPEELEITLNRHGDLLACIGRVGAHQLNSVG